MAGHDPPSDAASPHSTATPPGGGVDAHLADTVRIPDGSFPPGPHPPKTTYVSPKWPLWLFLFLFLLVVLRVVALRTAGLRVVRLAADFQPLFFRVDLTDDQRFKRHIEIMKKGQAPDAPTLFDW